MKLTWYRWIGKLINLSFHSKLSIFAYLGFIGLIISACTFLITDEFWELFIYIMFVAGCLSLTTVRLSNNIMFSRLTKHMSMNINSFKVYHDYDYVTQRAAIAEQFQEEFITAIETAYNKGYTRIKMTTHAWVYQHVLQHPRVNALYNIEAKKLGIRAIPLETLLLASNVTFQQHPDHLLNLAVMKRQQYRVKLTLKRTAKTTD
ncbi:hypothetical protein JOD82_002102 [Paenibacillus sp. 1182]|uniref:hypothetical protein n=1 Tax=Paenibacillus sp. 1182 TaxID=2806565 RepID=UPI001B66781C|nr:hypothetical protein [Paenibacillus sp. 1182]MBP1309082.1 hypothetical protein [Paenibacillus sp. 1182]